ncbi:hypothetical protein NDS46_28320 [Paenibacillus thiaminolyticus]|uniref:hypothetical protein n=1 Tax=Paenibacillus thiaminolyticus TaxID=49283 RepID=UPI00232D7ED6|nr:hypothetical protein [Paenibacillus thiaminolyticus]WCF08118.1 hypothetical protein NDS46_28320 [Paenibacillus thiaminolyticus]WII37416.1 hypothetical protein O0V01_28195 [Paenibacillus thiaminolyticus]
MENVHDNEIMAYEVNLQKKEIVLRTQNNNTFSQRKVDIVFSSVFAHYFEHEISGSIILDIEKGDLIDFLKDNKELLTQGYEYSWPSDYNTTEELMEKLEIEGYSYYIINSSYGLNGWVLAKESNVFVGD